MKYIKYGHYTSFSFKAPFIKHLWWCMSPPTPHHSSQLKYNDRYPFLLRKIWSHKSSMSSVKFIRHGLHLFSKGMVWTSPHWPRFFRVHPPMTSHWSQAREMQVLHYSFYWIQFWAPTLLKFISLLNSYRYIKQCVTFIIWHTDIWGFASVILYLY